MLIFQFTLPREERRQVQAQPLTLQNFNPRSHERSDHITQSFVFRFFNFNPRSHERSDHFQRTLWRLLCHISIHAPTRGATSPGTTPLRWHWFQYTLPREERQVMIKIVGYIPIFQSTLPREERPCYTLRFVTIILHFNPRSHERSDCCIRHAWGKLTISIHAPTRGATFRVGSDTNSMCISIHAPTRGATDWR